MSIWLIGIVTIIYLGVAISYWLEGNKGLCITFVSYAGANIGLIIASVK